MKSIALIWDICNRNMFITMPHSSKYGTISILIQRNCVYAACQDDMQQCFEMRVKRSVDGYYVFLSDAIAAHLSYLERCPFNPGHLIKSWIHLR